jgi:hypothetical protein
MHVEIPAGATVYFSAGNGEQYSVTSFAPPTQNLRNKPRGRSTAAIACFAFLAGAVLVEVPALVKASTHVPPSVPAVVTPPPSAPMPSPQPTNPFGLKP